MKLFFQILFISICIFPAGINSCAAQAKYNGPTVEISTPVNLSGLQFAGIGFNELGLKFSGCDTVNNVKLCFTKSTLGQLNKLKLTLIVRKGILMHFQVNTNDPKQVQSLDSLCMKYYGKPKKITESKSVKMISWENEKNGRLIQTFLITGHNFKKAELVSWVSN